MQNNENEDIRNIRHGDSYHKIGQRLKLCGRQGYKMGYNGITYQLVDGLC